MAPPEKAQHGWYVYGIVESDLEVVPGQTGVADAPVELVADGSVAALVSNIDLDRPLGTPEDLFAHKELLDATAADVPVLPFRFGAVLSSREAVVDELVEPHGEEFANALRVLEGTAQYVARARYVEEAVLREILAENPKAAQLRDRIGSKPDESTKNLQIQLGEIISAAVEAKRNDDTKALIDALEPVTVATAIRYPTHELDAAHAAILERVERHSDVEDALTDLAQSWDGRVAVRLLGPMAPYDFVVTTQ
jgi:hypothetical protein